MAGGTWWGADTRVFHRVLADHLHAELARLRLGAPGGLPPWLWTDDTLIGGVDAEIDSLDVLALSASVSELLPEGAIRAAPSQRFGDWREAAAPSCRLTHVTFRSSGSTGAPKRATHRLDRLEREAAAFAGLIGERRRVLSAIPAHHAYGFIHSVLVPRHLPGLPDPAEVIELRGCSVSQAASLLRSGDLVLGHPMFWDAVLRVLVVVGGLPPDIVGVTSTAPCADETALGLRAAGLARLVQVYGSAETAGIGWRDDPAAPYTLFPGWQCCGDGLCRDGQPVPTPDRLAWEGDRFRVLGRYDGVVQVGGVNVAPEDVALILGRHPAVVAVAVRMMRPDEGVRLKAFVVFDATAGDAETLVADLRRFARTNLSAAQCPGAYSFGGALPRGAMGKPADWICSEKNVD